MSDPQSDSSVTIQPSWKHFLFSYILSVLAIPLFGIGFVILYFLRRKYKQIRYIITNTRITSVDAKYEHNVDLVDIDRVEEKQSWLQEKLDIGSLVLYTSASKMVLAGLNNPAQIKNILEQAIQSEVKQQQQREEIKKKEPNFKPGSMEKMDYLTGLWQQGLISDKEYEAERKHFE